jgi:tetratricopeptide (TPR) repeat protein
MPRPLEIHQSNDLHDQSRSAEPEEATKESQRQSVRVMLDRYETCMNSYGATGAAGPKAPGEVFVLRDEIATCLEKSNWLLLDIEDRLSHLDQQLNFKSVAIWRRHRTQLLRLRDLIDPPKARCWWYAETSSAALLIAALFLLTVCISLLADFTRRLLSSDPDAVGILSIAAQALFTVVASSTFTVAGRQWLQRSLNRPQWSPAQQDLLMCAAVSTLFLVIFSAWLFLPQGLAVYYNKRGLRASQAQPSVAMRDYNRAINLYPHYVSPYVNLATLYVRNYDFEQAATQYRKALMIDVWHISAYNDLAYVLLLGKDPGTALRIMDEAFRRRPAAPLAAQDVAAMYKNLAWAEYQTGFYAEAAHDAEAGIAANNSEAPPYCVLAKADAKLNRLAEALQAWTAMNKIAPNTSKPTVDPDCARLAQEAVNANH